MFYSDNPGRDAERYMEYMENRPHLTCVVCEKDIYQEDEYYDVDGTIYCPDCMKDEFRKVADFTAEEW